MWKRCKDPNCLTKQIRKSEKLSYWEDGKTAIKAQVIQIDERETADLETAGGPDAIVTCSAYERHLIS